MLAMQERLVGEGFPTMTFNYLYTEQARKAPDRLPKLMAVHASAAAVLAERIGKVILAGKSMGGRVGGHVVADGEVAAAGLVYLGYPLVAMGKDVPRDTTHLEHVEVPQLFISGSRDRMGPNDLVSQVAASVPDGTFVGVDAGDHSLVPLKATGRSLDDSLDFAASTIASWCSDW
jgi:predicted alpha/beta-hydrolase family hydrolase